MSFERYIYPVQTKEKFKIVQPRKICEYILVDNNEEGFVCDGFLYPHGCVNKYGSVSEQEDVPFPNLLMIQRSPEICL